MTFIEISKLRRNEAGRRYGRLVVLGPVEVVVYGARNHVVIWLCKCDCGADTKVRGPNLTTGHTLSCGCLSREKVKINRLKHGHARVGKATPEYRLWTNIKKRCLNPDCKSYKDYGGRGILMNDEWQSSFEKFLLYIGLRPSPHHSIDRINNDGHYEPGNVRWGTKKEQANNTRGNRILVVDGESRTIAQWGAFGVDPDTISARLAMGWSDSDAVKRPKKGSQLLTFAGRAKTISEWALVTGVPRTTIARRLRQRLPIESVLSRKRLPRNLVSLR